MITPSMIRHPMQFSVPTSASVSDSLSFGSERQASWSSDRWAFASVIQTALGVCDPDSIGCQWLRDTLIALTALAFQHGFFTFHLLTLTLYERAITLGAGTSWL
jgi:hypothetical protein